MRWLGLALGMLVAGAAEARGVLPAGLYFRHHQYSTCPGCPRPTSAVITGVFPDERDAAEAVRRAAEARLAVGYPLVVHTEELGLADASADGIVVVAGLFASDGDALRFLDEVRARLPEARVAPLADSDTAFARLSDRRATPGTPRRRVVRIAAGAPVPAFARDERSRGRTPLCAVAPGALFLAGEDELRQDYRWAPVHCPGGEPAVVRWQSTLLSSTIRRTAGGYRLRQVTAAACDEPSFGEWRYDARRGRRPLHKDGRFP